MARTSKTAEGRSKGTTAAPVVAKKVATNKPAKTSTAATKKGKKTPSNAAVDDERLKKVSRIGETSMQETKSSFTATTADAVVPGKSRSRAALGNIPVAKNNNKNNNKKADDIGKKMPKTIETTKEKHATRKTTTTAATTAAARDGRGCDRPADSVVDGEEVSADATGSESDPDEDDEDESDYEDATTTVSRKTVAERKRIAAKATAATAAATKKKHGTAKDINESSSSSSSRGRDKKATATTAAKRAKGGGGVSVLEVLEEVVGVVDRSKGAAEAIANPKIGRKLANEDAGGGEFNNVVGGYDARTMYEEEYRADSTDDWRCMGAVDW